MTEELFDLSEEYDEMLNKGLSVSGEDKTYFIAGRIKDLLTQLPADFAPKRVLDFGCGIGDASTRLAAAFPSAVVVGADTAERALAHARAKHGSDRVRFVDLASLRAEAPFDLCYVSCVFHHIPPPERSGALGLIRDCLAPSGYLALFENNPWNPGARIVMSRIPFDRDAQTLSPLALRSLLREERFVEKTARSLFYFPRMLASLRFAEPWLAHVPLGAQYYVLARAPGTADPNRARS